MPIANIMKNVQQSVAGRMNGMANVQHVAEQKVHEIDDDDAISKMLRVVEYMGRDVQNNRILLKMIWTSHSDAIKT